MKNTGKSNLQYNTDRPKLILKEYGRNVQKLIEHVTQLEDDSKKNEYVHTLIELMKQINPKMKDSPEYAQRVWDDLYIMSKFEMKVEESPFPMPSEEAIHKKPEKVPYAYKKLKFKHYGKNVELMLQKAMEVEDDEERFAAVVAIARLMKSFYASWNKENVENAVILEHIDSMTKGKLVFDKERIVEEGALDQNFQKSSNRQSNGSYKRSRNASNSSRPHSGARSESTSNRKRYSNN